MNIGDSDKTLGNGSFSRFYLWLGLWRNIVSWCKLVWFAGKMVSKMV